MALLTVSLCPEILNEELLNIFCLELNIKTIRDFLAADPKKLVDVANTSSPSQKRPKLNPESRTNLTAKDIFFVRKKVFELFSIVVTNLGEEFDRGNLIEKDSILTGLLDLDRISEDGKEFFKSGRIYEIFGCPGVGKTQFSMFLSMKTAASVEGNVLYIDTKNDFCIDRLLQMIESNFPKNDENRNVILDKIRVCKIFDLTTLNNLLASLSNDQDADCLSGCCLLVLDNISSLVLPLLRDSQVSQAFGFVSHAIGFLRKVAESRNVVVMVVNNATTASSKDSKRKSLFKPALGKIFSSACHSRIFLEKVPNIRDSNSGEVPSLKGGTDYPVCKMTVQKSDISSQGKHCLLKLTEKGFENFSKPT